MISFVVAMEREAKYFLESVDNLSKTTLAGKPLYTGKVCGKDFTLILSGIGKVNAALSTQAVIDKFNPEYVFNFGTAGGANENVKHLAYYKIEKCCQYDFDLSELDDVSIGYIQDYDKLYFDCHKKGLDFLESAILGTADKFSNKIENINIVRSLLCDLRDMEGGAIAEVCASNNLPLVMIKGVTDTYDNPAKQFYDNLIAVCKGFPEIIEKAVKSIIF